MKNIENGIVYSNDIYRILKGNNALNYNYQNKGMIIPNEETINEIRSNFVKDTNAIFNNQVTIVSEEEMVTGMNEVIKDVYGLLPHRLFR